MVWRLLASVVVAVWLGAGAFALELSYVGNFRLPDLPGADRYTWLYSIGPVALDPATNTLHVVGHRKFDEVGSFPVADPGTTAAKPVWKDWTNGRLAALRAELKPVAPNGVYHRGLYWADGGLYGTAQPYYNVSNAWTRGYWSACGSCGRVEGFGKPTLKNLLCGGFCGTLPPELAAVYGQTSWCFESVPQGLGMTNQGPALYTYARSPSIPDNSDVSVTARFDSFGPNAYPGWWGDRDINGATFTRSSFVCTYRKSFGARWYGNASTGRLMGEASTVPVHTIYSAITPGKVAVDPYDNASQGYHAEGYKLHLLYATTATIAAGVPVWDEVDIDPFMKKHVRGQGCLVADPSRNRLYVLEWSAEGAKPVFHVFDVVE